MSPISVRTRGRLCAWPLMAVLATGCAIAPPDTDTPVAEALAARAVEDAVPAGPWSEGEVAPVAGLISEAEARALALERNARVRAWLAELDVAAADLAQAARIADPMFDIGALASDADGAGHRIVGGVAVSLTSALMRDIRMRRATDGFSALTEEIAGRIVDLLANVSHAHLDLVLARQRMQLREEAADAARTAMALAHRFDEAGNFSERDLAEVREMSAEVRMDALEARADFLAARAGFADLVGLDVEAEWHVADGVPRLPVADPAFETLRSTGVEQRLELVAQRTRLLAATRRLPEIERARWLQGIDFGIEFEREPDDERLVGPVLSWAPGIFDDRGPRLDAQRARVEGLRAELRQRELEVANAVSRQLALLAVARERAALVESEWVFARAERVRVLQQEVNFMLSGVFELLEARTDEYMAWEGYAEALAAHRLAWIELEQAVGMRLAVSLQSPYDPLAMRADAAPMDHGSMDHGSMDHGAMDHGAMDHGAMDHGARDHGARDHGAMDHESMDRESMDHEAMDHESMGHEAMGHEAMGHEAMDHEAMDHEAMDHEAMDHEAMDHEAIGHASTPAAPEGETP